MPSVSMPTCGSLPSAVAAFPPVDRLSPVRLDLGVLEVVSCSSSWPFPRRRHGGRDRDARLRRALRDVPRAGGLGVSKSLHGIFAALGLGASAGSPSASCGAPAKSCGSAWPARAGRRRVQATSAGEVPRRRDSLTSGTHGRDSAGATSTSAFSLPRLENSRLSGKTRSGKARRRSVSSSVPAVHGHAHVAPWQRATAVPAPGQSEEEWKMRLHTPSFDRRITRCQEAVDG